MTLNELLSQQITILFPVPLTEPGPASLDERLADLDERVRELERGITAMKARIALLASR